MTKKAADESGHPPIKPATRLVTGGRDPSAYHGFVNPPVYHASTVLYPHRRGLSRPLAAATTTAGAGRRPRRRSPVRWRSSKARTAPASRCCRPGLRRSPPRCLQCSQAGDHLLVTDTVYLPTRKFCDGVLHALRRRDHLLRSADRRRHRRTDAAEHARGLSRSRRARCRSRCRTFRRSRPPRMRAARWC